MRKKNIIGFLLAFVMLLSICTSSFAVYAEESRGAKESAVENKFASAEVMDEEKEIDAEKTEDPQEEEIVKEPVEPEKKVEKVQEHEKAKELKAQDSEDAIELGEEKVPGPVGAPEGFDLSKINTLAKDAEGNCYAVKDYGNTYDDVLTKYFYKIDEEDYNELSQKFLMTFKRKDGKPFKVYDSKISHGDIREKTPTSSVGDAIFTELKLRDHMVYESTIVGNFSPARRVQEQKGVDWYIELNKDWVIKTTPGFTNGSTKSRSIYIDYNVEVNGNGHRVYREDDDSQEIFCIGAGNAEGDKSKISLNNLIIDGANKYMGILLYRNTILDLKAVQLINGFIKQANSGGAITAQDGCEISTDADTIFKNCKAKRGGAINAWENVKLKINGSKFINNVSNLGGAICSLNGETTIDINGVTFDNNHAVAIGSDPVIGGAIYSRSKLNVESTDFKNNSAESNGGAIYSTIAFTVKNSEFTNNSSEKSGGAIYVPKEAPAKITNTTFSENKAKWGGAIANYSKSSIIASTFNNNIAISTGGAIYTGEGITVEKSSLVENKANKGGAIYISKGESEIKNTSFAKNQSLNSGGAIYINHYNKGTTKISGTRFTENASKAYGGGIFLGIEGKLEVSGSKFSKNQAAYGAGISSYINSSVEVDTKLTNIKVDSSEFTDNLSLMGAGICTAFPTEINNCTFNKNTAIIHPQDDQTNPHDSGTGGAVDVINNKTVIKGSTFEENVAQGSGGAIAISGVTRDEDKNIATIKPNVKVEISEGTKFIKNTCGVGQGGAIYTIPYIYDIEGYETAVPEAILRKEAYKNLTTAADTIFKDNVALSGFVDPPENYAKYTNLAFKSNSFTDVLPDKDVAKSLLNNYDVNYKNKKLSAFFDPKGGEFTEGANPKDIRVLTDKKDAEITLLDAPKRDGYKFLGWKCSMNIPDDILKELPKELIEKLNEGKIFKAGDKFKLDSNYIFIAQWEKDDTPTTPPTPEPKPEPKPEVEPRRHEYVDTISVIAKVPDKESYLHMSYLFGYPDKTIRPEGNMTRAEALAVVTRLEGYSFKDDSAKVFKDMKEGAWYNKYINAAFEHEILVEKEGEDFRPDQAITRAEFAKLISFIDKDNSKVAPFADVKSHVYEDAINKAYGNDRIKGYPDGTFRPDAKITRAEIVTILNNFYDRKADSESLKNVENIENLKHFKDLSEGYWAYYEITEAANSHEYVRRSGGLVENWIRLIEDLVK